jgi:hypothetical protein
MKVSKAVIWLSSLIAGLALIAAGVSLLNPSDGNTFSFATVRGATVQIYGQGWYRLDTAIAAVGFMAADVVTLVLALPLLVISTLLYAWRLKGVLLFTLAIFLQLWLKPLADLQQPIPVTPHLLKLWMWHSPRSMYPRCLPAFPRACRGEESVFS